MERNILEENPNLRPEDVSVGRTDEGFESALTDEGQAAQYRRREQRREQAEQEAVEQAAEEYEQRTGIDVGPGDFRYTDTQGVVPTESGRREMAAGDILGADPSDLVVTDEGDLRRTDEYREEQLAEQFARETGLDRGEGFTVDTTRVSEQEAETVRSGASALDRLLNSDFEDLTRGVEPGRYTDADLTTAGRAELMREQFAEERDLEPGEDFRVDTSGDDPKIELTDKGRVEMAGRTDAPPGDFIASTEGWIRRQATAHRVGRGAIPNLDDQAEATRELEGGSLHLGSNVIDIAGDQFLNPAGWLQGGVDTAKLGIDATKGATTPGGPLSDVDEEGNYEWSEGVQQTAERAESAWRNDPGRVIAGAGVLAAGGLAGSYASGRVLGATARAARRRARTVGGRRVDLEDLTQEEVIRGVDPDADGGSDFPGAQDPELYRENPPEAVRQQAEDMTPEEVQELFERYGVDEPATLKKAIEVEPEGPRRGRAGQGLRTQEGDYESPGSFAGPELSPYFLGEGGRRAGWSWRPGLPDTGESPTGVLVRTRVDRPDADTMDEFRREMQERAGETTARTKPAGDVNTGEIEVVIPPESGYAPLPQSRTASVARRLGIGSRLYTELPDGRRVPLRPVADPDAIDGSPSRGLRDLLSDDRAQAGGRGTATRRTYSLDELRSRGRPGTDRPTPLVPGVASGVGSASADADDYDTSARSTGATSDYSGGYSGASASVASSGAASGASARSLVESTTTGYSGGSGTSGASDPSTTTPSYGGPGSPGASDPGTPGYGGPGTPGTSTPTTPTPRLPGDDESDDDLPADALDDDTDERGQFDDALGPGWYAEYVTALALGPSAARGSPGQETLEERPEAEAYTSTLPTEAQVSGSEAEQEAIDEAYASLTFGGGGGGGSDDDGDPFDFGGGSGGWF